MPPAGTEGMGFAIFYTKDNAFLLGKVWTDLLAVYKKKIILLNSGFLAYKEPCASHI